ncbi:MAG: hypothetical protein HYV75_10055 [Opitutae bacterium]|nr:hypothetical protein [Opitutae bacterium]
MHLRFIFPRFVLFALFAANLHADPLTRQLEIDFGRDVASRNLRGLATRSDGRVLPGPVFTDLDGPKLGDILWVLKPAGPDKFVVGTGPEGKVQEVAFNARNSSYTVREVADVAETQAMAVQPLPNGTLLVGTSPTAAIYLVKDGKTHARVPLPADSVFDFLLQSDGTVLAATGNPGKIYRLDLAKLAKAGLIEGKAGDEKLLADKGVTVFGEIRDRNVRRLARLADGRVIAGSSPKGNLYAFAGAGGAPLILQENRDAEVVDLLPLEDGGFYAGIVSTPGDALRIGKPPEPKPEAKDKETVILPKLEDKPAFTGRSSVVRFPADGFPETVVSKTGIALYRLAWHRDWLLLTAGEMGDAFGYDPTARRSLTFAGSGSAQLNDLAPLGDSRFLLIRNNAPGLALLSFAPAPMRELETRRLDLGQPAELGAVRFSRLRGVEAKALKLEVRTNFGSDELEGWTPWTELKQRDGAFAAAGLRGRYAKFRLTVACGAGDFQIDKATLYSLPQNRRPVLVDFRILTPGLGLIPAGEQPPSTSASLNQVLFPGARENDPAADRRKGVLSSQVVPQPGTQIVYWTVTDPDGDNLAYTFSIRPDNSDAWTDLTVSTTDTYVQFETGGLPEGLYLTRLTTSEQAPRPIAQRLSYTFETDALLVDRTPPGIGATSVSRSGGNLLVSVEGADALSLLDGAEFVLNNGTRETLTHPVDGILDGKHEKFTAEIPEAKAAGATSVEILLYDQAGNSSSVRLPVK